MRTQRHTDHRRFAEVLHSSLLLNIESDVSHRVMGRSCLVDSEAITKQILQDHKRALHNEVYGYVRTELTAAYHTLNTHVRMQQFTVHPDISSSMDRISKLLEELRG